MSLLNDEIKSQLQNEFAGLTGPVKLVLFTQEMECQYCTETRSLAEEVAGLSDKIDVEVYDFVKDSEIVETYGIDKIPATVIMKGGDDPKDYGIRYFGIPSGYEFSSLIEDIIMVSSGDSGLIRRNQREFCEIWTVRVHLQVFVTPTCPYCPPAVRAGSSTGLGERPRQG